MSAPPSGLPFAASRRDAEAPPSASRNERYVSPTSARSGQTPGWSVHNLQYGERKPFTKAKDGWSASELEVSNFGAEISRQVAMSLEEGWEWVKGDEWRIDWIGEWSDVGVDEGEVHDRENGLPCCRTLAHLGYAAHTPQRATSTRTTPG